MSGPDVGSSVLTGVASRVLLTCTSVGRGASQPALGLPEGVSSAWHGSKGDKDRCGGMRTRTDREADEGCCRYRVFRPERASCWGGGVGTCAAGFLKSCCWPGSLLLMFVCASFRPPGSVCVASRDSSSCYLPRREMTESIGRPRGRTASGLHATSVWTRVRHVEGKGQLLA